MIIVSQDKTELINFNNIVRLSADVNANGEFLIEAHNFCDDFETVIGIYKSEERAKEVLHEIVGLYRRCQQVIGERGGVANFIYPPKVYEMPKE